MDIQNIYITDDIIDKIFDNLSYNSKINFSQTNNYMYNKYYDNIKYNIFLFLHADYRLYKCCINRFKYDTSQIKILGMLAISGPKVIEKSPLKYYDLRYIFELIMKNLDINDRDIVNANESMSMRFILNKINSCKSFNRFETKNKINNESSLISLHNLFSPHTHTNIHTNTHTNTPTNTHTNTHWDHI